MKGVVFREIVEIIRKNVKNVLRSKSSSLIIILGPLLLIFLAGMAFDNSNAYAVKLGIFRHSADSVTDEFVKVLHERFKVVEFDSEERCASGIKSGQVHTCMVFPENFALSRPPNNEISFYVDYSRINLVWTIVKTMTEEVGDKSLQAAQNLTKLLLDTIEFTSKRIGDQREVLVRLTTENDVINRNAADLISEFGDLDLSLDPGSFNIDNVLSAKTQLKQWMETSLSLSKEGLQEALKFISDTDNAAAGASSAVRDALIDKFKASVDDVSRIQEDLAKTDNLTRESFVVFEERISALSASIGETQERLGYADASREYGVRVLSSVRSLLDQSLINLLSVQNAFNEISRQIDSIQIRDASGISQPIVTQIKPIVAQGTYLNYLFPVFMVIVMMFTALFLGPTLVLLEKHSAASYRVFLTPAREESYVVGNMLTCLLILCVQMIIILAISSVFFSSKSLGNIFNIVLLLVLASSVFSLLGMLIGYVFNTEETAMLGAISLGSLFLFLSDVIIPIESMPSFMASLAQFNPFVIASDGVRRALLFDASFFNLVSTFVSLIGYIVAFGLIVAGIFLLTRRSAAARFLSAWADFRRPRKK